MLHLLANGVIVAAYAIFAIQMALQVAWPISGRGSQAVAALTVVFILCASAGYLTDLISIPMWLNTALHVALSGAAIWLVGTNQAAFIAKMMADERD